MANKNERLKKLEKHMIPPGAFMVLWEDPDKEGVYYDHPRGNPDRKQLSKAELDALRNDPDMTLFEVVYTNQWHGPGREGF